jgi:hypothetical protein
MHSHQNNQQCIRTDVDIKKETSIAKIDDDTRTGNVPFQKNSLTSRANTQALVAAGVEAFHESNAAVPVDETKEKPMEMSLMTKNDDLN